jgi:alcohol dehydrogenase
MADILNLRKFVAPEIVFGSGARTLLGRYAREYGAKKVLLVTDPGVINAGWARDVQDSLEEQNVPYVVYSRKSRQIPEPLRLEIGC